MSNTLKKRIIPCLDIKDGRTVSGIHFQNLRDCGDPVQLAKFYAEQGADELVFLDISASNEKRKTMTELVRKIGENIFIPFTVGGGISSIEDINQCLKNGADKVSLSTIAAKNPEFIHEASEKFGSQAIVVSVDVKKGIIPSSLRGARGEQISKRKENQKSNSDSPSIPLQEWEENYKVFIKGGKEETEFEAVEFARLMEKNGAGEILLNSLDRDGTEGGYDLDILNQICNAVNIPVIASSGAGSPKDLLDAFQNTTCDAVLASSIFHFGKHSLPEVKEFLSDNNIDIRTHAIPEFFCRHSERKICKTSQLT